MTHDLTARQARRIALAAQGFAQDRPERAIGRADLRKLARRLGVIQIDSVNVVTRTHYLPAFSRLGAYPREALETEAWGRKPSFFEYWGHEASLLPVELQPLFRWRMERARRGETWGGLARFARERRDYIDAVLERIEREGPLTGGDFADAPRQSGWWNWSNGKRALEWLFWSGFITTRTRRNFERVYDLTERVLPRAICETPTPDDADAQRELVRLSARAMGVATEGDLRDYFRLPVADTKARIEELVEAGELARVQVQGWRQPAYLAPEVKIPRKLPAAALLSPFDNLIWRRERTERVFGARIRLEIYTPAEKRQHGYYVLPFLQGEAITARVDLKADRKAGRLLVLASHLEPDVAAGGVAGSLAGELKRMSAWLGLGEVAVSRKGDLSAALSKEIG
ncbi:MAG TPA: winged helix-turn-helix domain-containing protein [Caulobacteraceae bacterium]|nr:winged helix-turn-helix domain-containing protein [Caulobacteraceae bacterium]